MRKWLLVGITLLVMALAFGVVIWTQREIAVVAAGRAPTPAPRPAAATTQFGSISRTESAWVMTFDKRTGLQLARFRGTKFTPREGDQVLVDAPEVEFFLGKNRSEVVRIIGRTGVVTIPGEGPRIHSNLTSTAVPPPTRGDMTDVVVTHYQTQDDAEANKPDVTLTLAKAYFDSDLYEISTEDYVDTGGKTIPAKDIPVTVRGDAFEFDGKGLTVRWDESSQRLKSLVVYQGIQLVIKRPGQMGRAADNDGLPADRDAVRPAAADAKAGVAQAAQAPQVLPAVGLIYRAIFHEGVKMAQEDQTLATAHEMTVDFPERGDTPTVSPVTPVANGSAAGRLDTVVKAHPAPAAAPQGAAGPGAQDSMGVKPDKPIVIRWGGQLTVGVAPDEALKPESDGDAVLRFAGTENEQAVLYDGNGSKIEATYVAYQVEKQFAWVEGTPGHDVKMTDKAGSVLTTPQLRYARKAGKATLLGPSSASVVSEANGKTQAVKATWTDSAKATFAGSGGAQEIRQLVLKGQVRVEHEKLKRFDAGALTLDFGDAQAGGKRQIRQVTASDGVDCTLVDENGKEQNIKARNVQLGKWVQGEKGNSYPTRLDASGDVVAGDGVERIKAQMIGADLDPPSTAADAKQTGPNVAGLRQLVATGDVELTGAKGELVKGSRLQVRQSKDRSNWVLLEGAPAVVVQEQTMLAGPFIEVDTATQKAIVTGGGKLVTADARVAGRGGAGGGGSKAWPVTVTWTGPGAMDGQKNVASVAGNVVVKYTDADGTANEAAADRVEIELADKEAEPATSTAPSRTPEMGFMSGKYAKHMTLLPREGQDVRLQSLLPGPGGTIARQINMMAMRLDCTLSKDGVQRIEAPATSEHPGRFLYVALPIATRQPMKTGDPMTDTQTVGATAFAWRQMMTYDKAVGQITMAGDVMVRHEPRLPGAKSFTVDAQTIVVDVSDTSARKATQVGQSGPVEAMEVKRIVMKGNPVHLTRDDVDMTSPEVEIDPSASMVYARGTPDSLVQVDKGRMLGSFMLVEMNTRTNEMKFTRGMATGRN